MPALPAPSRGLQALLLVLLALLVNLRPAGTHHADDDYLIFAALAGEAGVAGRGPTDLDVFDFSDGTPERAAALREAGLTPWWTDPNFRMRFARPLAAWTHRWDARLGGNDVGWTRLHNQAWAIAAVLAAWWALGFVLGEGRATFAAAIAYLVAPQDAVLVTWVSGRNALMAVTFGSLAFGAHAAAHREASPAWRAASLAFLGLGLLSNEGTVGALALLVAYEACLVDRPWRDRVLAILPAAALVVAWWAGYRALGFGASASGSYLEPGDPGSWPELARRYVSALSVGYGVGISSDLVSVAAPAVRLGLEAFALGAVALAFWVQAPFLARDARFRFLSAAVAASALPGCLGGASDRLLGLAMVPAAGLVVRILQLIVEEVRGAGVGRLRRAWLGLVGVFLLARTFVIHPLAAAVYLASFDSFGEAIVAAALSPDLERPDLAGRTLLMVNGPDPNFTECLPAIRWFHGRVVPGAARLLGTASDAMVLTRLDARRFRLDFAPGAFDRLAYILYRSPERPLRPGDRIRFSDMDFEVVGVTKSGHPREVLVTFAGDPEAPPYLWLEWTGRHYRVIVPPGVGSTRTFTPSYSRTTGIESRGPPWSWLSTLVEAP